MKTPAQIVEMMMEKDAFTRWMHVKVLAIEKGSCTLQLEVNSDMLNGFIITHGGISYSLSDSALAFAANAHGYKAVSIETSISHLRPTKQGDQLIATAIEKHKGKTIGIYEISCTNQDGKLVSLFKGTVQFSSEQW